MNANRLTIRRPPPLIQELADFLRGLRPRTFADGYQVASSRLSLLNFHETSACPPWNAPAAALGPIFSMSLRILGFDENS